MGLAQLNEAIASSKGKVMDLVTPRWQKCVDEAERFTAEISAPPVPVIDIAERNGVDVVFANFGAHSHTVAGFCDFEAAKLYVNKADSPERQMFTVAHEFGHWVMHKEFFLANPEKYPVFARFQRNENNAYEQEANRFAAHLLVPEKLLRPVIKAPVAALASAFRVSKMMMEIRLSNAR